MHVAQISDVRASCQHMKGLHVRNERRAGFRCVPLHPGNDDSQFLRPGTNDNPSNMWHIRNIKCIKMCVCHCRLHGGYRMSILELNLPCTNWHKNGSLIFLSTQTSQLHADPSQFSLSSFSTLLKIIMKQQSGLAPFVITKLPLIFLLFFPIGSSILFFFF